MLRKNFLKCGAKNSEKTHLHVHCCHATPCCHSGGFLQHYTECWHHGHVASGGFLSHDFISLEHATVAGKLPATVAGKLMLDYK